MTQSYGEILRRHVRSSRNPTGEPISLRQLAKAVGKSYEHCRSVLLGRPVASREFNDALCRFLKLDPEEMWRLAVRDKARRRFGDAAAKQLAVPPDERLLKAWGRLKADDRERVIRIAEKLAERSEKATRRRADDDMVTLVILDD